MKKLNAQKLIFLILMMMSLNVLLTDTYPVMNKTLALFGIVLTVLAFTLLQKLKNTRKIDRAQKVHKPKM